MSEIMTKKFIVGSLHMEIHEVANHVQEEGQKAALVESGKLVGLVTLTNVGQTVGVDKKMIEIVEKLSNMRVI